VVDAALAWQGEGVGYCCCLLVRTSRRACVLLQKRVEVWLLLLLLLRLLFGAIQGLLDKKGGGVA